MAITRANTPNLLELRKVGVCVGGGGKCCTRLYVLTTHFSHWREGEEIQVMQCRKWCRSSSCYDASLKVGDLSDEDDLREFICCGAGLPPVAASRPDVRPSWRRLSSSLY